MWPYVIFSHLLLQMMYEKGNQHGWSSLYFFLQMRCSPGCHLPHVASFDSKRKNGRFYPTRLFIRAKKKKRVFRNVVSEKICVLGRLKNSSISLVWCNIFTMDFWCGLVTTFSKRISVFLVLLVYNCVWPSFHIHLGSSTFSLLFLFSYMEGSYSNLYMQFFPFTTRFPPFSSGFTMLKLQPSTLCETIVSRRLKW